jgi:hypothetical protein
LGDPRLQPLDVLGRFIRPSAQRRRLARLGEVQKDQDGQSDDGRKSSVGAHGGDEMVHRKGEGN